MKTFTAVILSLFLFSCQTTPKLSEDIEGEYLHGYREVGVILLPGKNRTPNGRLIGKLRKQLHEYGLSTLALRTPKTERSWKSASVNWKSVEEQITKSVIFFRKNGISKIIVMGHSLGARYGCRYVSKNKEIDGFVGLGMRNNGPKELNCIYLLKNVAVPVLDVSGDAHHKDFRAANKRLLLTGGAFEQKRVPEANDKFRGFESEVGKIVRNWVDEQYPNSQTLMY